MIKERNLKKPTLLLVDDNQIFVRELKEALEIKGFDVVGLKEPERVLEIARVLQPEAIILDLKMPEKSGFEIISEFQEDVEMRKIPIIAVSAEYQNGKVGLMKVFGFRDFVKKPFSHEELTKVIHKVLL